MNDRSRSRPRDEKGLNATAKSGGAGVPPAAFLPFGSSLTIRQRRLPHWEVQEAIYFVTFRLADSLPKRALQKIVLQRVDITATAARMSRTLTASDRRRQGQLHARRREKALDGGEGECFLKNPAIACVVANALKEFDGIRYHLFAWSVMPNHVHVLFQSIGNKSLAEILHSWKSYSAKSANQILRRNGEFWQREYYDHLIRNMNEFDRAVRYIAGNPSKAGLKNWAWVWAWK